MASLGQGVYFFTTQQPPSSSLVKIAAFDLDWTLVRPIKGKFSKTPDDWTFLPFRQEVLAKLIMMAIF
jgi:hypothetical protein